MRKTLVITLILIPFLISTYKGMAQETMLPNYAKIYSSGIIGEDNNTIELYMTLEGDIPEIPSEYVGFVWALDIDKNAETSGLTYNNIGSDFNARVAYDEKLGGWYGVIDRIKYSDLVYAESFEISGNETSIKISKADIDYEDGFYMVASVAGFGSPTPFYPESQHITYPGDPYPYLEISEPEIIGGLTIEQNGVSFALCERIDEEWCKQENPGADGYGPFEFKWGDDKVTCSWFAAMHAYDNSGNFTIKVRAKNTCGFISERVSEVILQENNETGNCSFRLNYQNVVIKDPANDQTIPQNDIISTELKQTSNDTLQIKVTVRGNPLDLRESHYLVFFDSDNDTNTGRYSPNWNIGEDFTVRIGYDDSSNRWFASVESIPEGSMQDLPVLIKDNSAYVLLSLTPYRPSYSVGGTIKFAIDVVNVPGEGDYVEGVGELKLQNNLIDPGFKIQTENNIFSFSPHSMYLDFRERDNPLELIVTASNSRFTNYLDDIFYFSTKDEIAEIVESNKVRTNFDIINKENNSDFSIISAYNPECDLMINDYVMTVSGSEIFKHGRAAFVMPPYAYDQNNGDLLNFSYYLTEYDVAKVSSHALDIQTDLVGKNPRDGENRIYAYNFPACGWAGQPMWFGWGCVLQPGTNNRSRPAWGIYYHEVGHTFLTHIFSSKFPGLYKKDWGKYGEGWATLNGMYTVYKLIQNKSQYNLKGDVVDTLQLVKDSYRSVYVDSQDPDSHSVWVYENVENKNFSGLDANTMDGMFIILAEDKPELNPYGWEIYPRFYKVFLPEYWGLYDTVEIGKGETFFIAALSAAACTDLRYEFKEWNFPIDDDEQIEYYNEIYPILRSILECGDMCSGCELSRECYPLGYRKSDKFCSENKMFVDQREADSLCENSFECESNLCVDDKCVSSNIWNMIIEWFKALFGLM